MGDVESSIVQRHSGRSAHLLMPKLELPRVDSFRVTLRRHISVTIRCARKATIGTWRGVHTRLHFSVKLRRMSRIPYKLSHLLVTLNFSHLCRSPLLTTYQMSRLPVNPHLQLSWTEQM